MKTANIVLSTTLFLLIGFYFVGYYAEEHYASLKNQEVVALLDEEQEVLKDEGLVQVAAVDRAVRDVEVVEITQTPEEDIVEVVVEEIVSEEWATEATEEKKELSVSKEVTVKELPLDEIAEEEEGLATIQKEPIVSVLPKDPTTFDFNEDSVNSVESVAGAFISNLVPKGEIFKEVNKEVDSRDSVVVLKEESNRIIASSVASTTDLFKSFLNWIQLHVIPVSNKISYASLKWMQTNLDLYSPIYEISTYFSNLDLDKKYTTQRNEYTKKEEDSEESLAGIENSRFQAFVFAVNNKLSKNLLDSVKVDFDWLLR